MKSIDELEKNFSASYLKPELRTKIGTHDVFIADGFVPGDQFPAFKRRFGGAIAESDDYPNGCFATIWMSPSPIRGILATGIAIFGPDHDLETLTIDARKKARINTILDKATMALVKPH